MTPEQRAALRRIDRQFDAARAMPTPIPPDERYRHGVEALGRGGYLRFEGAVYRVEDVHHYKEEKARWYELELLSLGDGATVYLEWERDDEVEVCVNEPGVTLQDIGMTADEIEAISDRERGEIRFGGHSYHYDDDYKATFHRAGADAGEPVWFCDFETRDEERCLAVEEWGSEREGYEYEVYPGHYLDPDAVDVLVVGAPRD